MEFNERLRVARKQARMTQIELAEKAGIAVNSVRLYEAGKIVPKLDTIEKIAGALSVDVNWLLNGFTLKEHDEAFIRRLQHKEPLSERELYLLKHPDDKPAPARPDVAQMIDGLSEENVKQLMDYADFLKSRQTPQGTPGGLDDKEPAEK